MARLKALGATVYNHQQERSYVFWVMRDPWDNEFCVLQLEFPDLLARRRPWRVRQVSDEGSDGLPSPTDA